MLKKKLQVKCSNRSTHFFFFGQILQIPEPASDQHINEPGETPPLIKQDEPVKVLGQTFSCDERSSEGDQVLTCSSELGRCSTAALCVCVMGVGWVGVRGLR